jgi:dephospho-CoA kinase
MLIIGLTGGLASGKSEAARRFAALGVPVLDADRVARDLVAPGEPLLQEVFRLFGDDLRRADGSLDRAALGRRVFADPRQRQRLEALLHPAVRARLTQQLSRLQAPYAIVMAPLLIEAGMTDLVDRVLVIDAPESVQRERAGQRDGHDPDHLTRILAAQAERSARLAAADDVVVNDGDLAALHSAVEGLHRHYLAMAQRA